MSGEPLQSDMHTAPDATGLFRPRLLDAPVGDRTPCAHLFRSRFPACFPASCKERASMQHRKSGTVNPHACSTRACGRVARQEALTRAGFGIITHNTLRAKLLKDTRSLDRYLSECIPGFPNLGLGLATIDSRARLTKVRRRASGSRRRDGALPGKGRCMFILVFSMAHVYACIQCLCCDVQFSY